jgi:putative flippase GtrA
MERRTLGTLVYSQIQFIPIAFFAYFIVGGIAALVDVGGFMLLTGPFGIPWFWAALASFLAATTVNYVLSIRFVFESGVRFRRQHEFLMVMAVSAIGLLFNQVALWVVIEGAGAPRLPAKVIATGVVFLWNYSIRRHFIFRPAG